VSEPLSESLSSALAAQFGLLITHADPVRGLGDECEIWKSPAAGGIAIRISPRSRTVDDLEWVYHAAAQFAEAAPEVVLPLRGASGRTVVEVEGRPVAVWPWIAGMQLDRDHPAARRQAADLLARLHAVAPDLPLQGPRPQPVSRCDRCQHWADLQDPDLDTTLADWEYRQQQTRVPQLLHGDFYRRNLICQDRP
jgi:Ser/Thr protein kinase RdoA (MazF antagonist)